MSSTGRELNLTIICSGIAFDVLFLCWSFFNNWNIPVIYYTHHHVKIMYLFKYKLLVLECLLPFFNYYLFLHRRLVIVPYWEWKLSCEWSLFGVDHISSTQLKNWGNHSKFSVRFFFCILGQFLAWVGLQIMKFCMKVLINFLQTNFVIYVAQHVNFAFW